MRDTARIASFLTRLGRIWESKCPDWRFGQLMMNVLGESKVDPFFLEDEEMLKLFEDFFNRSSDGGGVKQ